jgi:hypothetical protein
VPDDLLRYIGPPQSYSTAWLWIAVVLIVAVVGWYAAIVVWTLPGRRLRELPLTRAAHDRLIRYRYAGMVRRAGERHRAGELSAAGAAEEIGRAVRAFLHEVSGAPVAYMHLAEISTGALAPAAPVVGALADAQFNSRSEEDIGELSRAAEELIRSWT